MWSLARARVGCRAWRPATRQFPACRSFSAQQQPVADKDQPARPSLLEKDEDQPARPSLLEKDEKPKEPIPKEPFIAAGAILALFGAMSSCYYAIMHDPRRPNRGNFMARNGELISGVSLVSAVSLLVYVVRK
eukprot:GEMP01064046.1.p2 GENE.GEMP01064046.1~~GEMP01064046.1.p2  ORF type:complete len:133 (+),score=31.44 GEMP01064046.1:49-447(+)